MLAAFPAIVAAAKSPAWRFVAAVVAALIFTVAVYAAGFNAASKRGDVDRLTAERDAAVRDLRISQQSTKVAEELADTAEIKAAEARKRADDYAARLPKGSGADLTDDDVRELQRVRDRKRR